MFLKGLDEPLGIVDKLYRVILPIDLAEKVPRPSVTGLKVSMVICSSPEILSTVDMRFATSFVPHRRPSAAKSRHPGQAHHVPYHKGEVIGMAEPLRVKRGQRRPRPGILPA